MHFYDAHRPKEGRKDAFAAAEAVITYMNLYKMLISGALCAALTLTPLAAQPKEIPSYQGEGMIIAVIDRGFDLTHEVFANHEGDAALTKEASDALLAKLSDIKAESCYVSEKIPFAYDYADQDADVSIVGNDRHGTAMLSLIGGNPAASSLGESFEGSAPKAQLLAMKIAADKESAIDDTAICRAISDAVTIGADVIYLGITKSGGFAYDIKSGMDEAIRAAHDAGVIVVASAGSTERYGTESFYDKEYGISQVTTENPDIGTIAFPASMPEVFAVGSHDVNFITSDAILLPDGTGIPYSDSNEMYNILTGGTSFAKHFAGQSFEYVVTNCLGSAEDLQKAGDLTGKFAVIDRGTLSFSEKAINAAALGAAGIIVIDTEPDVIVSLEVLMDLTDAPIPAILVSGSAKAVLEASAEKRFSIGEKTDVLLKQTPSPSSFSARGITPDRLLKPDLSVRGESTLVASSNGSYAIMNSVDAAAAKAAGMLACVRQRVEAQYALSRTQTADLTKALLVSSATPMLRPSTDSLIYSPRAQGGGAASVEAALTAELVLTANGKPTLSLGDRLSRCFLLELTAENIGDTEKICTLDVILGSDSFESFTYEQLDIPDEFTGSVPSASIGKLPSDTATFVGQFTPFRQARISYGDAFGQLNAYAEDYDPMQITLPPHSKRTVYLNVSLHPEEYALYQENFENGFFLEGFARLCDGEETVTLPFSGFSDDFYAIDAPDADLYGEFEGIYEKRWLLRYLGDSNSEQRSYVLGSDPFRIFDGKASASALYFSPMADKNFSTVYLNLGLLRSITDVTLRITNEAGELVREEVFGNLARTHVANGTGMLTSPLLPIWDGSADDYPMYIYPDGSYDMQISYRLAQGQALRSFGYTLLLDSTRPEILRTVCSETDGITLLTVEATDNMGIERIVVSDSFGLYALETGDATFDISETEGRHLYVEVYDKAMNHSIIRIENPLYTAFSDAG